MPRPVTTSSSPTSSQTSPSKKSSTNHGPDTVASSARGRATSPPTTAAERTTGPTPARARLAMIRAVSCSRGWKKPGPNRKLMAHSRPTGE